MADEIERPKVDRLTEPRVLFFFHQPAHHEVPEDDARMHAADLLDFRSRERTAVREDRKRFETRTRELAHDFISDDLLDKFCVFRTCDELNFIPCALDHNCGLLKPVLESSKCRFHV